MPNSRQRAPQKGRRGQITRKRKIPRRARPRSIPQNLSKPINLNTPQLQPIAQLGPSKATIEKTLKMTKGTTNKNPMVPAKGWPNVQAQLWCYSWIDSMLDVDEVILVNQVWTAKGNGYFICNYHPMWKRDDKEFNERCSNWFKLYGGVLSEHLEPALV